MLSREGAATTQMDELVEERAGDHDDEEVHRGHPFTLGPSGEEVGTFPGPKPTTEFSAAGRCKCTHVGAE